MRAPFLCQLKQEFLAEVYEQLTGAGRRLRCT